MAAVARYFFHPTGTSRISDEDGTDLPDDVAARHAAVQLLGQMLVDRPDVLDSGGHFSIQVDGPSGLHLCSVQVKCRDHLADFDDG